MGPTPIYTLLLVASWKELNKKSKKNQPSKLIFTPTQKFSHISQSSHLISIHYPMKKTF